jgi:hypothetical protein
MNDHWQQVTLGELYRKGLARARKARRTLRSIAGQLWSPLTNPTHLSYQLTNSGQFECGDHQPARVRPFR